MSGRTDSDLQAIFKDGLQAHQAGRLQDTGRLEDAVASHRRAIEINPDYAEAHINLGNALKELGWLEDA